MSEVEKTSTTEYKAGIIAKHLKERLESLRNDTSKGARPLMVSMQGPQGAGELAAHYTLSDSRQKHPSSWSGKPAGRMGTKVRGRIIRWSVSK